MICRCASGHDSLIHYWTTIIKEKEDITISDRPGIGVELDEEVGRQYQYPGTTWFT